MKAKILVAALATAGLVSGLPQAFADTITPPAVVPPQANPTTTPANYTATYPVNVTIGTTASNFNAIYNASTGTWTTSNSAWTYNGPLNQQANTAVFTTTSGGVSYAVALSGAGTTGGFSPALVNPVTVPPSVGVALNGAAVTTTVLPGFSAATATGTVTGIGNTSATLQPAPVTVQPVGTNPGGQPISVSLGGNNTASPTTGTSGPGSAGGSVAVSSTPTGTSTVNPVSYGGYTITFPTTPTPVGTASVNGTIAGSAGYMNNTGINIGSVTGTATYNTTTGVITATPTLQNGFNVNSAGNVTIGCASNTATTAGLVVCSGINRGGQDLTIGSAGTPGNITINGTTTMNGTLTTTGRITTPEMVVNGALAAQTLGVTGNAGINGSLVVNNGISNTGTLTNTGNVNVTGNLSVTGNQTVSGTLGITGATTLGSASTTAGNTVTVNSTGVTLASGTNGSVAVSSAGATVTGGSSSVALSNNGARFAGAGGAPVRVAGVADGSEQYDAVNFGQFDKAREKLNKGIAATAAMTNIPQVTEGKQFQIGVGVGGFDSDTALAIGGSMRIGTSGILKASVGTGTSGGNNSTAWGIGGGWSW